MSNEYVVVTTLSHFKLKYTIPLAEFEQFDLGEPIDQQKLLARVESGSIKEFSQSHLGEVVADVAVYDEQDIISVFDEDNNYLSGWSKEKKLDWINRWKDESAD